MQDRSFMTNSRLNPGPSLLKACCSPLPQTNTPRSATQTGPTSCLPAEAPVSQIKHTGVCALLRCDASAQ